jgi:membrane fusion protein (multidrug efflux system)
MTLDAPEQMEHMAEAKQKYTEATAMLQNSKDKYERLLETSKTPGTVAPHDITVANSRMTADEALVQGALANYKAQEAIAAYLTIRAPFDGVISERNVHPGALVGQAGVKPMLVLQQQNKFRLTINLPEQYSAQIKAGDVVTYTVSALPGKEFTGVVARSSGALSDKYRTESIEVDVANKDGQLKAGMHAEVRANAKGNGCAFVVPKRAVVMTTERKYVVVVDNGTTRWVDVTTGNQSADSIEVFGPLRAGDLVVTKANYDIGDGIATTKAGISVNR